MRSPTIVDLRNIYRPDEVAELGFRYASLGRPQRAGGEIAEADFDGAREAAAS
jgi:hypothetical protein